MAFVPRLGDFILRFLEKMRPSQVPISCLQSTDMHTPDLGQDRRFVLELPDSGLAHFALCCDKTDRGALAPSDPRLETFLLAPGRSYSVFVPVAPGSGYGARIRAARQHQHLIKQLSQVPFQQCQLRRLLSYSPGSPPGSTEKGFVLWDPRDCLETERALQGLLVACEAPRPHLGVFEADLSGQLWQRQWELLGGAGDGGLKPVGKARVVPTKEPQLHPAVPDLPLSVVFPSLEEVRKVFKECTSLIPEAQEVLNLVDKCPKNVQKGKFPVIAIEGLDATGKTTVTHSIAKTMNAVFLKSPPPCISQWRKIFDNEPAIIRRAYYSLGNYIIASEIAKASTQAPVIVDRYWHSTAAYAIATEISGLPHYLPPAHHPIYQWPKDLLKPDIILLLTTTPKERELRIQERGLEKTKEEEELEVNKLFREKVEMSYKRMENPGCHLVDAGPERGEVIQNVLDVIKKYCTSL
ncbi:UMP-CMP kinase 2, mitochondrial [Monodelphis domestica]|uniref:UMP-CMP kinase 2, mitochondrial n=1 Tax=Monodelphis domestica TaxID=13616 RepID=F7ASM8_MONDO|nr:UMP-CMP kinase 2, mitochondrial [Monodelphis domestica]